MLPTLARFNVPGHALAETGWLWPPPPPLQPAPDIDDAALQRMRMARALDQWMEEGRVAAVDELLPVAAAFRPDLIVGEMFMSAGPTLARRCWVCLLWWPAGRPSAPRSTPMPRPWRQMAQERLARLFARFGIHGTNWAVGGPPAINSPLLHLTFWSQRWYPGLPLLGQNRLCGRDCGPGRPALDAPLADPTAYGSTLGFHHPGHSFHQRPQLLRQQRPTPWCKWAVCPFWPWAAISREHGTRHCTQSAQPSVVVRRATFCEVLPYAAVAIHHGGAGTTHALVTHAVPQIVVPHAADQGRQAEGVARTGVGVRLHPRQVVPDNLAKILQAMLPSDAPFRVNARRLQQEFAELGGAGEGGGVVGGGDGWG